MENTSERLQQEDTTLKVQGYIQGFPKDSTGKKSPRIPPRAPKGYYEKRQRIPPRIPKGYYEKSPRIPPKNLKGYYKHTPRIPPRTRTGLQTEPTPKILQGNYKGLMKYIKNIRRTSRTQRGKAERHKDRLGLIGGKENTHQQSTRGKGEGGAESDQHRSQLAISALKHFAVIRASNGMWLSMIVCESDET